MDGARTVLFSLLVVAVTLQQSHSRPGLLKHHGSDTDEVAVDPVQQLEELKVKLQTLEQALEALDQNIETYVESEKKANDEAKRGKTHHLRTLDVQTQEGPELGEKLQNYVDSLSPEDKLALMRMKAKLKYLQNVLNEPEQQSNPGEDVVTEVKRSGTDAEMAPEDDAALAQFESELSPQDVELLKKMRNKVKFLQGALHEGPHQSNPGEENTLEEKKSEIPLPDVPDAAADEVLQKFENELSPQDQLLLKKFGAKMKFLQGALHEGPQNPNPGEDSPNQKRSEVTPDDPELQDFIGQLSPQDLLVLKKLQTKLKFLKGALHEGPQAANPGEETVQEKRSEESEAGDQTLQDFLNGLSAEDRAAIQHHKDKLKYLQQVLHEPESPNNPGEGETQEKRANPGVPAPNPGAPVPVNKKPAPPTSAKQAPPPVKTGANQIPAVQPQPPQNAPQAGTDSEVVFTLGDRILLKAVATKLEELRQTLEAFKVAHNAGALPAQQPGQIPAQIPAQVPAQPAQQPVQQPAKPPAKAPAKAPAQQPAKAPNAQKPAAKANNIVKPPTAGQIAAGSSAAKGSPKVHTRTVDKDNDCVEGTCGCPGANCKSPGKRKLIGKHKSAPSNVDIRELLRALSEFKDTDRAKRVVDNEVDELEQLVIR